MHANHRADCRPVILVPVNLLRKVRLSVRKKLALGGLFSITVIIMVFAIIRVVVVSSYSHRPDQTWLYLWSGVEQAVCKFNFDEFRYMNSQYPTRIC